MFTRIALLVSAFLTVPGVSGQVPEYWIRIPLPTTQDLLDATGPVGIPVGAVPVPLFAAVGRLGTIVTSPNGDDWTIRDSGTNADLNAISYGGPENARRFTVVGSDGLILESSDGFAWESRESGTTEDLLSVSWKLHPGLELCMAVGENGTILTSPDGVDWTTLAYEEPVSLHTVSYNYQRGLFVVGGENGTLFETRFGTDFLDASVATDSTITDAFSTSQFVGSDGLVGLETDSSGNRLIADLGPHDYTSWIYDLGFIGGTTSLGELVGISAFDREKPGLAERAISIRLPVPGAFSAGLGLRFLFGDGGNLWRSVESLDDIGSLSASVEPALPNPFMPEIPATYVSGDTVSLSVTAESVLPISYQWMLNGVPIVDAGNDTMVISDGNPGDQGVYSCAVWTADAYLTISTKLAFLLEVPRVGQLDPTFAGPKPDENALSDTVPLESGGFAQFVVIGSDLVYQRLLENGEIDPDFTPVVFGTTSSSAVSTALVANISTTGEIFIAANGQSNFAGGVGTLYKLDPDPSDVPVFLTSGLRFIGALKPLAEGKMLISLRNSVGGLNPRSWLSYRRLNADGSFDSSYTTVEFFSDSLAGVQIPPRVVTESGSIVVLNHGGTFGFGKSVSDLGFGSSLFSVVRFDEDGEVDPDYLAVVVLRNEGPLGPVFVSDFWQASDGSVVVEGAFTSVGGDPVNGKIRITPEANVARTYLSSLSVRTFAGAGTETLILGVALEGIGSRRILMRGVGPGLVQFGVPDVMADPSVAIFKVGPPLLTNNDWEAFSDVDLLDQVSADVWAFPLEEGSLDSAMVIDLSGGSHSFHVAGAGGSTGIALGEFYDASDSPAFSESLRVIGLSARARTGSGNEVLIAGFVVDGPNTLNLVIRGVGEGLEPFGISDRVSDTILDLYRGSEKIATNDDWGTNAPGLIPEQDLQLEETDSALVAALEPGVYTVHVRSKDGSRGIALIEVYEVR